MSQIIKTLTSGSPIPPIIPTSFVTDNGTAVPAANVLIIHGVDSTENNDNGIIAKGGVVGTGTANEVDLVLTNRATGTGSTVGGATANLITLPLGATPGVYTFNIAIAGFDFSGAGSPAGCGFTIVGAIRTTGAAATLINTQVVDHFEEAAVFGIDGDLTVSGNNAVVVVTGIAGESIRWNAILNYIFVS